MITFQQYLLEGTEKSDKFEKQVANQITKEYSKYGIEAIVDQHRSPFYSDIQIITKEQKELINNGEEIDDSEAVWLECKLSLRDHVANVSFYYMDGKWHGNGDSSLANYLCKKMNNSKRAKKFIDNLFKFTMSNKSKYEKYFDGGYCNITNKDDIIISTSTKHDGKKIDCSRLIPFELMQDYMKNILDNGGSSFIVKYTDVDFTKQIANYFKFDKKAPVYYIQLEDNLYQLTNDNPIGFENLPNFSNVGNGNFNVRCIIRPSRNIYDLTTDIYFKINDKHIPSEYSFKPGTKKKKPKVNTN